MKFRKRPITIDAIQFTPDNWSAVLDFVAPKIARFYALRSPVELVIPTPEGEMTAMLGDWIIRGVAGECYPCKPEIFAVTYEYVPEEDDGK